MTYEVTIKMNDGALVTEVISLRKADLLLSSVWALINGQLRELGYARGQQFKYRLL